VAEEPLYLIVDRKGRERGKETEGRDEGVGKGIREEKEETNSGQDTAAKT
jgi:hypothetical protein